MSSERGAQVQGVSARLKGLVKAAAILSLRFLTDSLPSMRCTFCFAFALAGIRLPPGLFLGRNGRKIDWSRQSVEWKKFFCWKGSWGLLESVAGASFHRSSL